MVRPYSTCLLTEHGSKDTPDRHQHSQSHKPVIQADLSHNDTPGIEPQAQHDQSQHRGDEHEDNQDMVLLHDLNIANVPHIEAGTGLPVKEA